jgi:hypothetical protein
VFNQGRWQKGAFSGQGELGQEGEEDEEDEEDEARQ